MWIWFRVALFVTIAFSFSVAFTMPLILTLNALFVRASFRKVFRFTLLLNILTIITMMVTRFAAPMFSHIVEYYLGILGIGFGVSMVFLLTYGAFKLAKKAHLLDTPVVRWGFLIVLFGLVFMAIYNYEKPLAVTEFTIESEKVSKEYRFVHVADTQLGTTSVAHLNSVVDLIAQQQPDFVVFVGDLIDSNGYEQEDFASFEKVGAPVYFERGNHEFYHDAQRLLDVVHNIPNFEPLINEQAVFEEIQITSVDFSNSGVFLKQQLEFLPTDENMFSILLYHDPKPLGTVLDQGFDLMLAGHTHGGQIWPITWIVETFYAYGSGYHIEGDTHIYTTSGAGLWGPRMRLGSRNEIALFTIKPKG